MENSTPLLPQYYSNTEEQGMSLDDMIERSLGDFGWPQFLQTILVSLPLIFDGQQAFISVYTDTAWSSSSLDNTPSLISGLPASSFFMGCLIGGFALAFLGDSFLGRRSLLFISCLGMSVSALITIFSNNVWVYSGLRFMCGVFRSPIITTVLVLLTETVGKRRRGQVTVTGLLCFTLGLLSLPPIAYINRSSSWRTLYAWTSIPGIVYSTVAYFFVSESPRWLFVRGQEAQAHEVLTRLSSTGHGKRVTKCSISSQEKESTTTPKVDDKLFTRRWVLHRLLGIMVLGFGIGMAYYGLLLGVGNLGFNIYLSITFNGLLDIPSYFLAFILIQRWNRRKTLLTFSLLGGFSSLICALISDRQKGIRVGLELVSFFSVSITFNVVLIYTTEMFPTSVRNSAASVARQTITFGSVFSPILVSAGREIDGFLSYGVFGLLMIFCGFFVLSLPETRGVTLCDTLDEQEYTDEATFGSQIM